MLKMTAKNEAPINLEVALKPRLPAFLCALALLLCALATYPVAEIGIDDDWSYVHTARVFAQTGHIVYNGWAAMPLGWLIPLGALFVKIFGPSFTAIRASTLLIALFTAFLLQRILVRTGISSRNATFGTLALVLSPLFLPLGVIFMSDMAGLFCVVLCLYACLRALQARSHPAVLGWLAFAALSNAVGGTVRQIAWLGVLVMFPSAVWLLRRRPHVLSLGTLLYGISLLTIFTANRWFLRQPHSVAVELHSGLPSTRQLVVVALHFLSFSLSGALVLVPALAAFVPKTPFRNRRVAVFLVLSGLLSAAIIADLGLYHQLSFELLLAPFLGRYVSVFGIAYTFWIKGSPPVVLSLGLQLLLTAIVLFVLLCFVIFLATSWRASRSSQTAVPQPRPASWNELITLLTPFSLAYTALLFIQDLSGAAYRDWIFDRYLLSLLPIALTLLLRIYQERVQPDLPWLSYAVALLFAVYAVAGTHDVFARARARHAAVKELLDAGIPDDAIDAGFEHNAMIQIDRYGYINDPGIRLAATDKILRPPFFPANCKPQLNQFTPAMVPGYALAYDPTACGGLSHFAPVSYWEWLLARKVPIYVVDTVEPAPDQR
jgi:dolichyl-phosphate-mannose-protein mannosyltransferase